MKIEYGEGIIMIDWFWGRKRREQKRKEEEIRGQLQEELRVLTKDFEELQRRCAALVDVLQTLDALIQALLEDE